MNGMAEPHSRSRYRRTEGLIVGDMGGEKVMMSVDAGKYYNLGRVGGRIWELLERPATLEQLVDALTLEYDVDREVCAAQVRSFLAQLLAEKLLEVEETEEHSRMTG